MTDGRRLVTDGSINDEDRVGSTKTVQSERALVTCKGLEHCPGAGSGYLRCYTMTRTDMGDRLGAKPVPPYEARGPRRGLGHFPGARSGWRVHLRGHTMTRIDLDDRLGAKPAPPYSARPPRRGLGYRPGV